MSVLVRSRFQITYRWQTSFLEGGEEILQIVLVVGLISLADKAGLLGVDGAGWWFADST